MTQKDKTFEEILMRLRHSLIKRNLTIKSILKIFSGKIKLVLLILLSICSFVSVPGLTILFGCLISYVGIRMVFGKKVWIPQKILHLQGPNAFLRKVARKGIWFNRKIKKFSHSRYLYMFDNRFMKVTNGIFITILGLLIAFLPIPFISVVPAAAVFLISLGSLDRDGLLVIIGYAICLLAAGSGIVLKIFV